MLTSGTILTTVQSQFFELGGEHGEARKKVLRYQWSRFHSLICIGSEEQPSRALRKATT